MVLLPISFTNLTNATNPKKLFLALVGVSSIWMLLPMSSQAVAASLTNSPQLSTKTGFEHESTDLIADILYLRPSSTYRDMSPNGAYRVNQDYALGLTDTWYIEEQRFGADALISGLLHDDPLAIEAGLKMFSWGFSQQLEDGSFGNTSEPFHSTSLFIQSVAYALLTVQESPSSDQYRNIIAGYLPQLHSAARWMIQEDIWTSGLKEIEPFTHRYYIVAAALGLTGKLTNDPELINYANQTIITGLEQQRNDGVNPEKDGHDSSYQMSGALYAMRWLAHFSDDPLAGDIANMLDQALLWEDSVILETGAISGEGNTRTEGGAISRTGATKQINHREVVHGFAYWYSMTNESLWESNAIQVAQYYYADDQRLMFNLDEISDIDPISPVISKPHQPSQSVPESSFPLGLLISGTLPFICMSKKSHS